MLCNAKCCVVSSEICGREIDSRQLKVESGGEKRKDNAEALRALRCAEGSLGTKAESKPAPLKSARVRHPNAADAD